MIEAYRHRVRRTLVSVAIAVVGAACVTVSGWALQAAALPPPTAATRVAADASAWLHEHRLVVDVFHSRDRRQEGACLRGWFAPNRPRSRGSLLYLESGRVLGEPPWRYIWLAAAHGREPLSRLLALVGCSGELAPALGAAAQGGGRLTTERSYAANQPAIALELERRKEARLTLYVSPEGFRPLVAFVDLDGHKATARLYLARMTPRFAALFHLRQQRQAQRR